MYWPLEEPLHPSSAVFLHFNLAECIYHKLQPAQALCEDGDIKISQPAVGRAWLTRWESHSIPSSKNSLWKRQSSLNAEKYLPWLVKKTILKYLYLFWCFRWRRKAWKAGFLIFFMLNPPLSSACVAVGQKLLSELEKVILVFPLAQKQELCFTGWILTFCFENSDVESIKGNFNLVFFLFIQPKFWPALTILMWVYGCFINQGGHVHLEGGDNTLVF